MSDFVRQENGSTEEHNVVKNNSSITTTTFAETPSSQLACKALNIVLNYWTIPKFGWDINRYDDVLHEYRDNLINTITNKLMAFASAQPSTNISRENIEKELYNSFTNELGYFNNLYIKALVRELRGITAQSLLDQCEINSTRPNYYTEESMNRVMFQFVNTYLLPPIQMLRYQIMKTVKRMREECLSIRKLLNDLIYNMQHRYPNSQSIIVYQLIAFQHIDRMANLLELGVFGFSMAYFGMNRHKRIAIDMNSVGAWCSNWSKISIENTQRWQQHLIDDHYDFLQSIETTWNIYPFLKAFWECSRSLIKHVVQSFVLITLPSNLQDAMPFKTTINTFLNMVIKMRKDYSVIYKAGPMETMSISTISLVPYDDWIEECHDRIQVHILNESQMLFQSLDELKQFRDSFQTTHKIFQSKSIIRSLTEDEPWLSDLLTKCLQASYGVLGINLFQPTLGKPDNNATATVDWKRKLVRIMQTEQVSTLEHVKTIGLKVINTIQSIYQMEYPSDEILEYKRYEIEYYASRGLERPQTNTQNVCSGYEKKLEVKKLYYELITIYHKWQQRLIEYITVGLSESTLTSEDHRLYEEWLQCGLTPTLSYNNESLAHIIQWLVTNVLSPVIRSFGSISIYFYELLFTEVVIMDELLDTMSFDHSENSIDNTVYLQSQILILFTTWSNYCRDIGNSDNAKSKKNELKETIIGHASWFSHYRGGLAKTSSLRFITMHRQLVTCAITVATIEDHSTFNYLIDDGDCELDSLDNKNNILSLYANIPYHFMLQTIEFTCLGKIEDVPLYDNVNVSVMDYFEYFILWLETILQSILIKMEIMSTMKVLRLSFESEGMKEIADIFVETLDFEDKGIEVLNDYGYVEEVCESCVKRHAIMKEILYAESNVPIVDSEKAKLSLFVETLKKLVAQWKERCKMEQYKQYDERSGNNKARRIISNECVLSLFAK